VCDRWMTECQHVFADVVKCAWRRRFGCVFCMVQTSDARVRGDVVVDKERSLVIGSCAL